MAKTAFRAFARNLRTSDRSIFSNEEYFAQLANAALPLPTKIEPETLRIPKLYRERDNITKRFTGKTLAILATVLPDNVSAWPYGIEGIINQIGEADSRLNSDERLIELKRRWAARSLRWGCKCRQFLPCASQVPNGP
ncbi:MAG: hypothetical protein IOC35_06685 [Methylobacterium sp.]|jgi:hypothetical protein|nr:hypothetical protein [Methylobacterium sp.]